jgi:predicted GNAT family N-acyltransferase
MVELRRLNLQDIEQALQLSKAENWNQTEKEWELLIGNRQNICVAATLGDKLIGTATAINYENKVGWIGMVVVDKEYRGQKISNMLLSGIIENSKNIISLKLDATPAGLPVYQKFGFTQEYLVYRFISMSVFKNEVHFEPGISVERAIPENLEEITEYDKQIFGAERKQLIEFLIRNFPEKSWILRLNGQINGIALGRIGSRFHQVGPVFASSPDFAKKLILKSLEDIESQPVIVDIPAHKPELTEWINTLGFTKQRHFVRMYRNENTFAGLTENQFLICGPEFG